MKTKIFVIALLLCVLSSTTLYAKVWRVDNNTLHNAGEFTRLIQAYDAAADGDTIYVFGSSTSYESLEIDKRITIIGPGYFLGQNPDSPLNTLEATLPSGLTFKAGAEGSVVMGLVFSNRTYIETSNISLIRNKFSYQGHNVIEIDAGVIVVEIKQNYIEGGISLDGNNNNINICNNYISAVYYSVYTAIYCPTSSSLFLTNNVISGNMSICNSILTNNILKLGNLEGSLNSYSYNFCDSNQFGSENGNQAYIDMSTVFVDEGSEDGKWQLKSNSPVAGQGFEGEDPGMFGGDDPYVLSGQPNIPVIYFFTGDATGTATTGLNVHIKGKSMP